MAPLESSRQASILRCGCDEMERPGARVRFYTGPWSSTFIIIPILTKEFASFDDEEAGRQEGSQTATQVKAGLPAAPYREQTVAACALLAHNNTAPKFVNNLCPTPEFLSSARFPFPGDSEACVWLVERAENLDRHLMQTPALFPVRSKRRHERLLFPFPLPSNEQREGGAARPAISQVVDRIATFEVFVEEMMGPESDAVRGSSSNSPPRARPRDGRASSSRRVAFRAAEALPCGRVSRAL
ncbi:hypothetical protein AXG93_1847s1100 [Marchantia polymorpha subsp. ruderalis]|uniref:Uncharacterized protein n=1 Tax=Marchantia polymorpha subsp. ruderalis TaxID=1480154 RepID=A0A176VFG6_MARPO|nr:hypothetical protein AXG93_1847s1100 [Marchantia polymorpha subsp. ruderalis]